MTALEQYNTIMESETIDEPIERLRFFLSLALTCQDWLDVEQFIDGVSQQLASRDAEVAELKSKLFDLTKQRDALSRMADSLEQERDQLSEQVAMLRDALKESVTIVGRGLSADVWARCREALAATEPKS